MSTLNHCITEESIKDLFEKCELFQDYNINNVSIYPVESSEKVGFRIDIRGKGSAEVFEHEGDEQYCLKNDEWVYVENKHWTFRCLSEIHDEYPKITFGEVINAISK